MSFWIKNVLIITFSLSFVFLVKPDKEIIDDYQLADEICKKAGPLRSSLEPPYVCVCEHGYVRHDGVCVPQRKAQEASNEGRRYDDIDSEIERIRNTMRQQNQQQINEGFNVVKNENDKDLNLAAKEDSQNSVNDPQTLESDPQKKDSDPQNSGTDSENAAENDGPLEPQAIQQDGPQKKEEKHDSAYTDMNTMVLLAVVAACSIAGLVGLVVAGVCWYKLQRSVKATAEAEYPAYGVTGPTREKVGSPGDRKLAQSAQMYHYQHQKQQMLAMEKANGELGGNGSDVDSEEENEEGDYTVYECPGLAPTGEMEVKNPLFNEDTPTVTPGNGPNNNNISNGHGEGRM